MFGDDDEKPIRYVERRAKSMETFSQMRGLSPPGEERNKNIGVHVDRRVALFQICNTWSCDCCSFDTASRSIIAPENPNA